MIVFLLKFLIKTKSMPLSEREFFDLTKQVFCHKDLPGNLVRIVETLLGTEAYSEPCQTSKMERFLKIVNNF